MKMLNPEMEVIRFNTEDVIATSGAPANLHVFTTGNLGESGSKIEMNCGHEDAIHRYYTANTNGTGDVQYYQYKANGDFAMSGYYSNKGVSEKEQWYYRVDKTTYILCNGSH